MIFEEIAPKLKNFCMLDIGVGAGRTTHFFANNVKKYIGIDYSSAMVAYCKSRFEKNKNILFYVCDARDMSRFADNSFDFILFSFNGIDYVNSSDRSIVFREIYRICKPDGIFCFSTHNIQSLNQIFSFKFKLNPLDLYIAIFTYLMLRLKNPRWQRFKNLDECELVDLGEWFKLKTVYIKPIKQITCLKNLGFKNIRVFSYNNGLEIKKYEILTACQDVWLQYLCQCSK